MINHERYIEDILKTNNYDFAFNKRDRKIIKCDTKFCKDCLFSPKNRKVDEPSCNIAKMKWLGYEYKQSPIKLTRLEYGILNHILNNTDYSYIARDRDGRLFIYEDKPCKTANYWNCSDVSIFNYFDDLFQFVQWKDEEPRAIKDILESCEVVNDAKE